MFKQSRMSQKVGKKEFLLKLTPALIVVNYIYFILMGMDNVTIYIKNGS